MVLHLREYRDEITNFLESTSRAILHIIYLNHSSKHFSTGRSLEFKCPPITVIYLWYYYCIVSALITFLFLGYLCETNSLVNVAFFRGLCLIPKSCRAGVNILRVGYLITTLHPPKLLAVSSLDLDPIFSDVRAHYYDRYFHRLRI